MKMPLGKEVGHIVLDGDQLGTQPTAAPPHFRPMPIVTKRSPVSATAELLLRYWRYINHLLTYLLTYLLTAVTHPLSISLV